MIDFQPALRFLKKYTQKGSDIAKNLAAFAKHHPFVAAVTVIGLGVSDTILARIMIEVTTEAITSLADTIAIDALCLVTALPINRAIGQLANLEGELHRKRENHLTHPQAVQNSQPCH